MIALSLLSFLNQSEKKPFKCKMTFVRKGNI